MSCRNDISTGTLFSHRLSKSLSNSDLFVYLLPLSFIRTASSSSSGTRKVMFPMISLLLRTVFYVSLVLEMRMTMALHVYKSFGNETNVSVPFPLYISLYKSK